MFIYLLSCLGSFVTKLLSWYLVFGAVAAPVIGTRHFSSGRVHRRSRCRAFIHGRDHFRPWSLDLVRPRGCARALGDEGYRLVSVRESVKTIYSLTCLPDTIVGPPQRWNATKTHKSQHPVVFRRRIEVEALSLTAKWCRYLVDFPSWLDWCTYLEYRSALNSRFTLYHHFLFD